MRLGIEQERDRKTARDATNLPLFELTEERTHLGLRRLPSFAHLKRHVEPTIGYVKFSAFGVLEFVQE